jgi:hypothetical protein
MDRKYCEQRFNAMKAEATSWVSSWKDLTRYIRPTRGFFDQQPNIGTMLDHKTVINGHAMRAIRILSSGMTSGLTSPSRPWFKLGLADAELADADPVKIWLDDLQKKMFSVFSKSNIYSLFPTIYEEIGLTGTSCTILLEDFDSTIKGKTFTIGEYYLGTGGDGKINSFAREYWLTVAQLVEEFGLENCSSQVKALWENKEIDKWIKVIHLIEPNDDRNPNKYDNINMPYKSLQWEFGSKTDENLNLSGFEEFPVLAPRWDTTTTADIYGKGPGWDGLGDAKMLQRMQKDKLAALDKVINPPVQVNSSSAQVNMLPGGVSRFSDSMPNAGVKPSYQINPDFNAIENSIGITKDDISKTFYSDLFLMLTNIDRSGITAREVVERHEEKLLMLGPVLERLEGELLKPLIDRTFQIMLRNNQVPIPPMALQGQELKVEFISVLAQAQKMVGTSSIEQMLGFVGNIAQVNPNILDVINYEEAAIQYADMVGLSPKILRSKAEIEQMRQQRMQEQQVAQQAAHTQGIIQGAKTLADTKLGQNSALDAITSPEEQGGINAANV